MSRRLVVLLTTAALLAVMTGSAIGAARYCGTGVKYHGFSKTTYVSPSWNRPGYRVMQTRKLWSATSHYYVCKPTRR